MILDFILCKYLEKRSNIYWKARLGFAYDIYNSLGKSGDKYYLTFGQALNSARHNFEEKDIAFAVGIDWDVAKDYAKLFEENEEEIAELINREHKRIENENPL